MSHCENKRKLKSVIGNYKTENDIPKKSRKIDHENGNCLEVSDEERMITYDNTIAELSSPTSVNSSQMSKNETDNGLPRNASYEKVQGDSNFKSFLKDFDNDPCNVLIYEPSGGAKSLIATSISSKSRLDFLWIKGTDLMTNGKDIIKNAKLVAPCIILFSDFEYVAKCPGIIDDLAREEESFNELQIFIVGIIKYPGTLPAYLGPLHFDKFMYIPLPDFIWRKVTFKKLLEEFKTNSEDITWLSKETKGFTIADIKKAVKYSKKIAVQTATVKTNNEPLQITKKHFSEALRFLEPSLNENETILAPQIFFKLVQKHKELKQNPTLIDEKEINSLYEYLNMSEQENKKLIRKLHFIEESLNGTNSETDVAKNVGKELNDSRDIIINLKCANIGVKHQLKRLLQKKNFP